jgi:alkylated DNA repair protein (DNA oxidative demethylase)
MSSYHSGLIYLSNFVPLAEKKQFLEWLKSEIFPIWEMRYSVSNPPPDGEANRQLLRPVYWLGNWQFACLNYYHPPKGIHNRCVTAEPFSGLLQKWVAQAEAMVHDKFPQRDIPRGWHLNTCLINYYGTENLADGKKRDAARVGEHKDFEPGPVASISFGERAIFQFVRSAHRNAQSQVVLQQWLEDSSLQIFGGDKFKKHLFHRVQRVEDKIKKPLNVNTDEFETRRINLTFRYVPIEHYVDLKDLPENLKQDVLPYVKELSKKSDFFKEQQNSAML